MTNKQAALPAITKAKHIRKTLGEIARGVLSKGVAAGKKLGGDAKSAASWGADAYKSHRQGLKDVSAQELSNALYYIGKVLKNPVTIGTAGVGAGIGAGVKASQKKKAAITPPVVDQASTTADQQGFKTNMSAAAPKQHHYYQMPMQNGRPQMPNIRELGGAQNSLHKEVPRIMEYNQGTNGYQMHQYPYAKPDYPAKSNAQYDEALKLLQPTNNTLPAESKQNYQQMQQNGTFDPATALQYSEYLKWRNATGGKTQPVNDGKPSVKQQQMLMNTQP